MSEQTLEAALREIAAILDGYDEATHWGCGNDCQGCQCEMAEAAAIAKRALLNN